MVIKMVEENHYLSVKAVCVYTGLSRATLYRLSLPYIKVGRRRLYHRQSVDDFLKEREVWRTSTHDRKAATGTSASG
jgi:excisionase family DNA binding protein